MFIPLLTATIFFCTSLHGMENKAFIKCRKQYKTITKTLKTFFTLSPSPLETNVDLKLYEELESQKTFQDFTRYCIESKKNRDVIINAAHNPRLLTYCTHIFLPKDISYTIGSYLSGSLVKNYKHKLIAYKTMNDHFKEEKIDSHDQWLSFYRHDGTYSIAPNMGHNYAIWNENKISRRNYSRTFNNEKYVDDRMSIKNNKVACSLSFAENDEEQDKAFFYLDSNYPKKTITFGQPMNYYLFSNDATLVAFCCSGNRGNNIQIFDTKTLTFKCFSLNGSITSLCSAHHSPLFVAGSNHCSSGQKNNLLLIIKEKSIYLTGHKDPIVCTEFSPDDTRLVTCSYNSENNNSTLKLYDTSDFNNITCIQTILQHGKKILKAFFIYNGQRIAIIHATGYLHLLDGLTGEPMNKYSEWNSQGIIQKEAPVCIWSNKHALFINAFENQLRIRNAQSGKYLGCINCATEPNGMGLTVDENTMIFVDRNNNTYKLPIYNEQDCKDIDFIAQATIVQLYEIFEIQKHTKNHDAKIYIEAIKMYILEQQQK